MTIDDTASAGLQGLSSHNYQPNLSEHIVQANGNFDGLALSATDLQQIWQWNTVVPSTIERCVHDIFQQQAREQPDAPAICAWDGELSYAQLDKLSTALAVQLVDLGVTENSNIPLCFNKSLWTTVAMLGVMKSGAAFVLLDPSLPEQRLRSITAGSEATIVVSAIDTQILAGGLAPWLVVIGPDMLDSKQTDELARLPAVNPQSNAYVAFTSGSTGTPKGAVLSHRNLATALFHQETSLRRTKESRVYDFCSYSFDVSICNVFSTLAVGGCFCVPKEEDRRNRLAESIASLNANTIDLTPSVARLLSPEDVPSLKTIIFGGEALRARDVRPWWGKVQIVNLYGPCECTPNATLNYEAGSPEDAVHIGKGIGLLTWVVDADDHESLVPIGTVGELLLEGPLVGNGYLNEPEKTAAAFIETPAWLQAGAPGHPGRRGKVYKTGDLVHYTKDGNLIFSGRKDMQVKVRGQRIELGEIEHVIRLQEGVDDAAVVLQQPKAQDPKLAGYITIQDDHGLASSPDGDAEKQVIGVWEKHFDDDTYSSVNDITSLTLGRDFIGWTSMYDGRDIDSDELQEWLDDTMTTISNGQSLGRILEIGTGSGMILFNITEGLDSYVGLEPSGRAVEFVANAAKTMPEFADKVKVFKAAAEDLHRVDDSLQADLVIINSVAQYFPSQGYLLSLIEQVLKMEDVKTIFFGDVRSYALHRPFLIRRAIHMAGENTSAADLRRLVSDMQAAESELLVDPAFFTSLCGQIPSIKHVEILPKLMRATNELSSYRYAAVLHVERENRASPLEIHRIEGEWTDFEARKLDSLSLVTLLQQSSSPVVAISNIPYSKTILERHILEIIDDTNGNNLESEEWLSSSRHATSNSPALSATDLTEIAAKAGYRVELSWARQHSQNGGLDAVFHQKNIGGKQRCFFNFPTDHDGRPRQLLSSHPLRHQRALGVKEKLQVSLKESLPSYMIPDFVTVLDAMPLNDNGKIDRRSLANRTQEPVMKHDTKQHDVMSETEKSLRDIWSEVLNIEASVIKPNDSFFSLGGNSLAAMRLVSEARMAGHDFSVLHVFKHPELRDIAHYLETFVDEDVNYKPASASN